MTESIKFFWNGIKINGEKKLIKCFYSLDNNRDGTPEVSISADRLPGDLFAVSNDTDLYIDYFDNDRARLTAEHPLYKYARRAALESEIHFAKSGIKYAEKRVAAGGYMSDYYERDAAERRERLNSLQVELEEMPKGQPTAEDLEDVREMKLAAETARKAREHAEELERREKYLRERNAGRAYIESVMDAHPLNSGEPVVTIEWSEHVAFRSWEDCALKMSVSAAEIILKHFDDERHAENVREGHGGYEKTSFIINYTDENGEAGTYEGRYDLGDGDGGLIAHIRKFGEGYTAFKHIPAEEAEQNKAAIISLAERLELVVYADKVRGEIAEEAEAAGMTVEQYAANGYRLPEDGETKNGGGAVVSVSFAPWVAETLEAKRKREQEDRETDVENLLDALHMMTSCELEAAVFMTDPKDKDGKEVGRFFLRELYSRDEAKALEVFRKWQSGTGAA